MTTTFRADLATGLLAILDAFKAVNPTMLRTTSKTRPPHFNKLLPFGFVDTLNESGTHDSGTRTRSISPSLTFVDRITDNIETMDRFNLLVDTFADFLTTYPHVIAGTIWSEWTVTDGTETNTDGTVLQAATFTLQNLTIQEGRV